MLVRLGADGEQAVASGVKSAQECIAHPAFHAAGSCRPVGSLRPKQYRVVPGFRLPERSQVKERLITGQQDRCGTSVTQGLPQTHILLARVRPNGRQKGCMFGIHCEIVPTYRGLKLMIESAGD